MDIQNRIAQATEDQVRLALNNVMSGLADLGFGADGMIGDDEATRQVGELFADTLDRCLCASAAGGEQSARSTSHRHTSRATAHSMPVRAEGAGGVNVREPEAMTPPWSELHASAALREGWIISECFGSRDGPWQIQRMDDASDVPGAAQLETDGCAWYIVCAGTGEHHAAALAFVQAHNPREFERLMAWAPIKGRNSAELVGSR